MKGVYSVLPHLEDNEWTNKTEFIYMIMINFDAVNYRVNLFPWNMTLT